MYKFDVIVIGGGHAGAEAAYSIDRAGLSCALITMDESKVGQMSCNPAIGGLGKSHIVREIDAMGGLMAIATDMSGIQYRTLNTRKGDAVQALRVQCDRDLYKKAVQKILNKTSIQIIGEEVVDLIIEKNSVQGVITKTNRYLSKKTILTTGTFLNGKMYTGKDVISGGRAGEQPSVPLSEKLYGLKLPMGRLKTGTPARIKLSSIDISKMEDQPGDVPTPWMSISNPPKQHQTQLSCFITRTNKKTHEIIKNNIHLSAMYSGEIQGIGPRYCPSIEDKIYKFQNKDNHQIFIEPEGIKKDLVYPNGISTSLPKDTQAEFIRSIKGMENSEITEYGYAVEYDFVDPRALEKTLQLNSLKNLYLAGQINGTTGYEEAAAQGLIAGINASNNIKKQDDFVLDRSESYIGVMVDDLTSHGITEPYRMFTSRAEHRLLLSQNNAQQRLLMKARKIGMVDKKTETRFLENEKEYKNFVEQTLKKTKTNFFINKKNTKTKLNENKNLYKLLSRNDVDEKKLFRTNQINEKHYQRAITEVKYAGYIAKQLREINKTKKQNNKKIPKNINYKEISGLSNEVREKLINNKPKTIGGANQIEGITPAALNLILIHIKKSELLKENA